MTRHFVLGNGTILVGLDKDAQLRDFYFPYVGQENHVNGKVHRLGIWIDGSFSWFSSPDWKKSLSYMKETLVTNITGVNEKLGIDITINDAVCRNKNIFIRKVTITNKREQEREVRLFFHQHFEISEANIGDTVYYNPLLHSLIHYKGKRYFLMNGCVDERGITEYATGLVGEYGLEGTYKDAEDGILSNNPIEHGSVDSTISFHCSISANQSKEVYYWICVGEDYKDISTLNKFVLTTKPEMILRQTEQFWKKWVNRTKFKYPGLSESVVDLFKRSLLIISTQIDKGGAIIASSDSDVLYLRKDTYSYMWPRDGALIARSLDRAGYGEITERFFQFCCEILTAGGYFFHKYRPDGSLGSSWHPWLKHGHLQLPIQEDQIALVLDALWKHFIQHGDKKYIQKIFPLFIRKAADFMLSFIDLQTGLPKESYDLWEEKLGIHTFTCATIYAGFIAAANFERVLGTKTKAEKYQKAADKVKNNILKHLYDPQLGYFIKMIYYEREELKKDTTLDISSSYGIFQFGVLPGTDPRVQQSMNICKERLQNKVVGGFARYEYDSYYQIDSALPGNPWFITTLWLAEYYLNLAQTKEELQPAIEIFEWVAAHALETGVLSEQLHPHTGKPISVAPLTWSHAGLVIAINKYLEKLDHLGVCKMCNPPKFKPREK